MKLLLVEDELGICNLLKQNMSDAGYGLDTVSSGEKALVMAKEYNYDAFIIDISLPGMDGLELCRTLRDLGTRSPIMILTARDKLSDKITGLDSGADDYMTKPFELAEFNAHIRALLRKGKGYERPVISVDTLLIDPNQKRVTREGKEIELSRKEYTLLEFMGRHLDQIVTRPMISHAVWENETSTYTNIIDVFIASLRKKIDSEGQPKLLHTVRGRGFMLSKKQP